jgi:hypothetical protein
MILSEGKEIAPAIFLYENVIEDSDTLIEEIEKNNLWNKAVIYEQGKMLTNTSKRDTEKYDISWTFQDDLKWYMLVRSLWTYGNDYAIKHSVSFSQMETPQVLKYKENEGFYVPHFDSTEKFSRVFSAVLYLNDVEEGGETVFTNFGISIKPKKNTLAIFPANFAYVHQANKPISNDKYVVVTWFAP